MLNIFQSRYITGMLHDFGELLSYKWLVFMVYFYGVQVIILSFRIKTKIKFNNLNSILSLMTLAFKFSIKGENLHKHVTFFGFLDWLAL